VGRLVFDLTDEDGEDNTPTHLAAKQEPPTQSASQWWTSFRSMSLAHRDDELAVSAESIGDAANAVNAALLKIHGANLPSEQRDLIGKVFLQGGRKLTDFLAPLRIWKVSVSPPPPHAMFSCTPLHD
jgi:hypothetical protein